MKVAVVGAGSWGTALAAVLAKNSHDTILWSRGDEVASGVSEKHENKVYLPGIKLPESLTATTDLETALSDAELVLAVVPSHAMRETMQAVLQTVEDVMGDIVTTNERKILEIVRNASKESDPALSKDTEKALKALFKA